MLLDSQAEFRKGIETMDYVLSFTVNKELQREGGKVIAFFVDFRAAFDLINRKLL